MPASYWSHGYVRKTEWQRQWMMSARLDYAPVVDVRRARAKDHPDAALADAKDAAIEAAKYCTKATDLLALGDRLPEFAHQIRGHRLVAMSRDLRRFVPDGDPTAAELATEIDPNRPGLHPTVACIARWAEARADYVLTPL